MEDESRKLARSIIEELAEKYKVPQPSVAFTRDSWPDEDWSSYEHDSRLIWLGENKKLDKVQLVYEAAHEFKHYLDHIKLGDSKYRQMLKDTRKANCTSEFLEIKAHQFARDALINKDMVDKEWLEDWEDKLAFFNADPGKMKLCADKETIRITELEGQDV